MQQINRIINMGYFLGSTGLTYLWAKIKDYVQSYVTDVIGDINTILEEVNGESYP